MCLDRFLVGDKWPIALKALTVRMTRKTEVIGIELSVSCLSTTDQPQLG